MKYKCGECGHLLKEDTHESFFISGPIECPKCGNCCSITVRK